MISLFTERRVIFLGGLLLLDVMILAVFGWLWFHVQSERLEAASLEAQLEQQLSRERNINASQRLLADLSEREDTVDRFILPAGEAVAFLEMIEEIAHLAGLSLEVQSVSVEPLPGEKEVGIETLKLSGRTEGGWAETLEFVALLESAPFSVVISELNLNKTGEGGTPWLLSFTATAAQFKRQ